MTIKEVEEQTGLPRSNIRFYEKEELIEPSRNEKNGYRDYSEKDIEIIKKIAYLRTLEISIEDIHSVLSGKISLMEIIEKQTAALQKQIEGLNNAKIICERMLTDGNISFDNLQVEKYVTDLQTYWNDNKTLFKLDSISFLHIWGSRSTWTIITALCLIVGILTYTKLPADIPVQWNKEIAISFADKKFIFIYFLACIIIRFLIKPIMYVRLLRNYFHGALVAEYVSNYLCFIALSIEIFSILFIYGLLKSIVIVLAVDTAVLIGLLIVGISKMSFI